MATRDGREGRGPEDAGLRCYDSQPLADHGLQRPRPSKRKVPSSATSVSQHELKSMGVQVIVIDEESRDLRFSLQSQAASAATNQPKKPRQQTEARPRQLTEAFAGTTAIQTPVRPEQASRPVMQELKPSGSAQQSPSFSSPTGLLPPQHAQLFQQRLATTILVEQQRQTMIGGTPFAVQHIQPTAPAPAMRKTLPVNIISSPHNMQLSASKTESTVSKGNSSLPGSGKTAPQIRLQSVAASEVRSPQKQTPATVVQKPTGPMSAANLSSPDRSKIQSVKVSSHGSQRQVLTATSCGNPQKPPDTPAQPRKTAHVASTVPTQQQGTVWMKSHYNKYQKQFAQANDRKASLSSTQGQHHKQPMANISQRPTTSILLPMQTSSCKDQPAASSDGKPVLSSGQKQQAPHGTSQRKHVTPSTTTLASSSSSSSYHKGNNNQDERIRRQQQYPMKRPPAQQRGKGQVQPFGMLACAAVRSSRHLGAGPLGAGVRLRHVARRPYSSLQLASFYAQCRKVHTGFNSRGEKCVFNFKAHSQAKHPLEQLVKLSACSTQKTHSPHGTSADSSTSTLSKTSAVEARKKLDHCFVDAMMDMVKPPRTHTTVDQQRAERMQNPKESRNNTVSPSIQHKLQRRLSSQALPIDKSEDCLPIATAVDNAVDLLRRALTSIKQGKPSTVSPSATQKTSVASSTIKHKVASKTPMQEGIVSASSIQREKAAASSKTLGVLPRGTLFSHKKFLYRKVSTTHNTVYYECKRPGCKGHVNQRAMRMTLTQSHQHGPEEDTDLGSSWVIPLPWKDGPKHMKRFVKRIKQPDQKAAADSTLMLDRSNDTAASVTAAASQSSQQQLSSTSQSMFKQTSLNFSFAKTGQFTTNTEVVSRLSKVQDQPPLQKESPISALGDSETPSGQSVSVDKHSIVLSYKVEQSEAALTTNAGDSPIPLSSKAATKIGSQSNVRHTPREQGNADIPKQIQVELDRDQRAVLEHWNEKCMLINAGPGSGKTLVLCHLVSKIFHEQPTARVLVLTFNRFAVAELRRRLTTNYTNVPIIADGSRDRAFCSTQSCCLVSTFHAFAFKSSGKTSHFVEKKYDPEFAVNVQILREQLKDSAARSWDWVIVDEAQDVNQVRGDLITVLQETCKHLVLAGDPRQSLHEDCNWFVGLWRDVEFPGVKKLLRFNHRSSPHILDFLNQYSEHNFSYCGLHMMQLPSQNHTEISAGLLTDIIEKHEKHVHGHIIAHRLLESSDPDEAYAIAPVTIEKYDVGTITDDIENSIYINGRTTKKIKSLSSIGKDLVIEKSNKKQRTSPYQIGTVCSLKGTERSKVVVYGVSRSYCPKVNMDLLARRIYVALSRARENLHVITNIVLSKNNPLFKQINDAYSALENSTLECKLTVADLAKEKCTFWPCKNGFVDYAGADQPKRAFSPESGHFGDEEFVGEYMERVLAHCLGFKDVDPDFSSGDDRFKAQYDRDKDTNPCFAVMRAVRSKQDGRRYTVSDHLKFGWEKHKLFIKPVADFIRGHLAGSCQYQKVVEMPVKPHRSSKQVGVLRGRIDFAGESSIIEVKHVDRLLEEHSLQTAIYSALHAHSEGKESKEALLINLKDRSIKMVNGISSQQLAQLARAKLALKNTVYGMQKTSAKSTCHVAVAEIKNNDDQVVEVGAVAFSTSGDIFGTYHRVLSGVREVVAPDVRSHATEVAWVASGSSLGRARLKTDDPVLLSEQEIDNGLFRRHFQMWVDSIPYQKDFVYWNNDACEDLKLHKLSNSVLNLREKMTDEAPAASSLSLEECVIKHFGMDWVYEPQRAFEDAVAVAALFVDSINVLSSEGSSSSDENAPSLAAATQGLRSPPRASRNQTEVDKGKCLLS